MHPLSIEVIKSKLPNFLLIKEETYKGSRYKATFIDTEYNNEEFDATVCSVIKLQSGCPSRTNDKRRKSAWTEGTGKKIPIEDVMAMIPEYLEIDPSTYKGIRYEATFYDKEYKVTFNMIVRNVTRTGKGYCKERQEYEFKKSVCIPIEEIESRIFNLYGDKITLIREEYQNVNVPCGWLVDNKKRIILPMNLLEERYFCTHFLKKWRAIVLVRDSFQCQKCKLVPYHCCAHHVLTFKEYEKHRFNINNGLTLCKSCHQDYHSKFKFKETLENFLEWLCDPQKGEIIKQRLDEKIIMPPFPEDGDENDFTPTQA